MGRGLEMHWTERPVTHLVGRETRVRQTSAGAVRGSPAATATSGAATVRSVAESRRARPRSSPLSVLTGQPFGLSRPRKPGVQAPGRARRQLPNREANKRVFNAPLLSCFHLFTLGGGAAPAPAAAAINAS